MSLPSTFTVGSTTFTGIDGQVNRISTNLYLHIMRSIENQTLGNQRFSHLMTYSLYDRSTITSVSMKSLIFPSSQSNSKLLQIDF